MSKISYLKHSHLVFKPFSLMIDLDFQGVHSPFLNRDPTNPTCSALLLALASLLILLEGRLLPGDPGHEGSSRSALKNHGEQLLVGG